jgi:predicted Holliday junction resolvase-like endonuclease
MHDIKEKIELKCMKVHLTLMHKEMRETVSKQGGYNQQARKQQGYWTEQIAYGLG